MIVHLNLPTSIRYTADGQSARIGPTVTLRAGSNEITPAQHTTLMASGTFKRHLAGGHVTIVAPAPSVVAATASERTIRTTAAAEAAKPTTDTFQEPLAPAKPVATATETPGASGPADPNAAFLTTYDAMSAAEQAAIYPALSDAEKAIIDARVARGARRGK